MRHISLFLLVFCPLFSYAQIYRPGSVVTNAGDTIKGFLEERENTLNPINIRMRSSPEIRNTTTYHVKDIQSFAFDYGQAFHRFYVSITLDPVELKFATNRKVTLKFDTVFLKLIQKGPFISFYSYEDELKMRYYIRPEKTDKPLELGFNIAAEGGRYVERRPYRDMLKMFAETSGTFTREIAAKISRSNYTEASLLPIISAMNGIQPKKVDPSHPEEGKGWRIGAGINLVSWKLFNENILATNATTSAKPGLWIRAGYDLPKNSNVGKFVFRGEFVFTTASGEISASQRYISRDLQIEHSFTQYNVGVGLAGMYNFINKPKAKAFISLGVRGNYAFYTYTFNEYRTDNSGTSIRSDDSGKPRTLWTSLPVKLGAVVNRKYELGVTFIPKRKMHSYTSLYMYALTAFEIGMVYHLNLKQR